MKHSNEMLFKDACVSSATKRLRRTSNCNSPGRTAMRTANTGNIGYAGTLSLILLNGHVGHPRFHSKNAQKLVQVLKENAAN